MLTISRKFSLFSEFSHGHHHPEKFRKHSLYTRQTKSANLNQLKSNSPNCLQVVRAQFAPKSGNSIFQFSLLRYIFCSVLNVTICKFIKYFMYAESNIYQPGLNSQSALEQCDIAQKHGDVRGPANYSNLL